jgi:hypothetical protein
VEAPDWIEETSDQGRSAQEDSPLERMRLEQFITVQFREFLKTLCAVPSRPWFVRSLRVPNLTVVFLPANTWS